MDVNAMIHFTDALTNNSLVNKRNVETSVSSGRLVNADNLSQYLLNKEGTATERVLTLLEDDTVDISAEAVEAFSLEQAKESKISSSESRHSSLISDLIANTKEKIAKLVKELKKITSNSEGDKQHRKALQAQIMLLNNQLLLLIKQKIEALTKK